jgi:DNA processing protein
MSACAQCQRRSWLMGALNGRLEYVGRSPTRLAALLELSDKQLIEAVGGSEGERLRRDYARLALQRCPRVAGVRQICRHDPGFPKALTRTPGAPRLLHVAGGLERLRELLAKPTVAIVGARAASDYGMEVAHGLARGLAASGVTVLSGLAEGIASAAHEGALEVEGPTLTVSAGGVDVCHPASRRALQRRLCAAGCALAELPCGERPRSWCHAARARIVVALASVVVVVEAGERSGELLHARLASDRHAVLAAVPGRVTSPLSRATHALLRDGAHLVRDAQDVLDALYGVDEKAAAARRCRPALRPSTIEPRLRALLDEVAAGRDTVAKLLAAGAAERETLIGLARLECSGALIRGDAGRYVARL